MSVTRLVDERDRNRGAERGQVLEVATKLDVNASLTPLVFLILPVTVAFAIFPATIVLNLGF